MCLFFTIFSCFSVFLTFPCFRGNSLNSSDSRAGLEFKEFRFFSTIIFEKKDWNSMLKKKKLVGFDKLPRYFSSPKSLPRILGSNFLYGVLVTAPQVTSPSHWERRGPVVAAVHPGSWRPCGITELQRGAAEIMGLYGVLWGFYGDSMGILWDFGNFMGILWDFGNSMGLDWR